MSNGGDRIVHADRLGHTGITWPFTPEGAKQAIADLASLGYRGFETFGFTIDQYPDGVDGLRADLDWHGIALVSAYCSAPLIDPATASEDIAKMVAWARKVKDLGGSVIVVGAGRRQKPHFSPADYRGMVGTLNEVGRRCLDLGIAVAFHPHTGTPVETRAEIDQVMGAIDPDAVFFAPDTGQIEKGGSDPVDVLRTYLPLIRHVHLKDYDGGPNEQDAQRQDLDRTGYLNYTPVGSGVVDIPGIVRMLDDAGFAGWWMVELDGTPAAPYAPKEAAAMSKRYLDDLMAGTANG
jgi:inosose dehydratase